jgi:ATP phosphoribosyltransferase
MMNVPEGQLDAVADAIPGMSGPTVMEIAGQEKVAVHAVVEERDIFETINDLRERGATDILVTEIERLVE